MVLQTITRALLLLMKHTWLFEMIFELKGEVSTTEFPFILHVPVFIRRPQCLLHVPVVHSATIYSHFIILTPKIDGIGNCHTNSLCPLPCLLIQEPKKSSLTRTLRLLLLLLLLLPLFLLLLWLLLPHQTPTIRLSILFARLDMLLVI